MCVSYAHDGTEYSLTARVSEQIRQGQCAEADGDRVPQRGNVLANLQHHLSTEVRGTAMGAGRTGKRRAGCGGYGRFGFLAGYRGYEFEAKADLRFYGAVRTLQWESKGKVRRSLSWTCCFAADH